MDGYKDTTRGAMAAELGLTIDELDEAQGALGEFERTMDERVRRELAAGNYTVLSTEADRRAYVDTLVTRAKAIRETRKTG